MNNIIEKINDLHGGDTNQLEAIFTEKSRVMLVAPAGCGKTKTFVSRISYLLSLNRQILQNKKILALTFSVNAAFKMRKDILELCPELIGYKQETIQKKIFISNYHGFARNVIAKYGYLMHEKLRRVNEIIPMNEENVCKLPNCNLNDKEKDFIKLFANKVTSCDNKYIDENIDIYLEISLKLLEIDVITYNSYLVFLIKLFADYKNLQLFYRKLYPIIMIDEFQDTNYLSWTILQMLIEEKSELFFMGDNLQRIYGFIGAIPDLIEESIIKYKMEKITLGTNYRFKNNTNMLLLDSNIRKNADGKQKQIIDDAKVKLKLVNNVDDETEYALELINTFNDKKQKLAILVKGRSGNLNLLLEKFENEKIEYFYALFSEEDEDYIKFHLECINSFYECYQNKRIGKAFLNTLLTHISSKYKNPKKSEVSLLKLTKIFFDKIINDYTFLDDYEKVLLINDTFISRSLKQNMDKVNSNIIVSTIHGAKGLEWDYVYFPSVINFVFPNYKSLCQFCNKKYDDDYCILSLSHAYHRNYIEEMSVFYVGVTRAREDIFFSAPLERINAMGAVNKARVSCLLSLKGIKIELI